MPKKLLLNTILVVLSLAVCFAIAEIGLRLKNLSGTNYDIEMWRYANTLKKPSANPTLGHEHERSASAKLQNVEIRLNELGFRGPPLKALTPDARRILFLGSSITLGWGVPEQKTMTALLQKKFDAAGAKVETLNAGIGNYNTARYVENFMANLTVLKPTDIVLHYFLNDAEKLGSGGGNFLTRNTQLGVLVWGGYQRLVGSFRSETLVDHYRAVYDPKAPGFTVMTAALDRIKKYADESGARVYLAIVPDVHFLTDYPFGFIHERMKAEAEKRGFAFLDFLPAMRGLTPDKIWILPDDPHPNALGHEIMADTLFPVLANTGG